MRGLSLAAFDLEKNVFIATSAAIDLGVDLSRTIIYLYYGYFGKDHYVITPVLLLLAFSGSYIGKLILTNISQVHFKNIVLFLIFGVGVIMLWRTIQA